MKVKFQVLFIFLPSFLVPAFLFFIDSYFVLATEFFFFWLTGHDYSLYVSDHGGGCDCGDELSWKRSGFCKKHCIELPEQSKDGTQVTPEKEVPPVFSKTQEQNIRTLFSLVIKSLLHIILLNVIRSKRSGSAPLPVMCARARGNFKYQKVASKLLSWISSKTEVYTESRSIVCSAFLQALLASNDTMNVTSEESTAALLEKNTTGLLHKLFTDYPSLKTTLFDGCQKISEEFDHADSLQVMLTLLTTLKYLPSTILDALTTCILRLSYDEHFKFEFTKCMIWGYEGVCDLDSSVDSSSDQADMEMQRNFLTRLTVQLFNCPNMTLELVKNHSLLDTVLGFLIKLLKKSAGNEPGFKNVGLVAAQNHYIAERVYSRTLGDIQMILDHRATVIPYILQKRMDLMLQIVHSFLPLQGMNVYHRQRGNHVERENTDWINCVMLESDMFLNMLDQFFLGFSKDSRTEQYSYDFVDMFKSLSSYALILTADTAKDDMKLQNGDHAESKKSIFGRLLQGEGVSAHLPLHRICSRILHFILSQATSVGKPENFLAFLEERREYLHLETVIQPILKVHAFMMQVRLGLWVRNGEEVLKLQRTYNTAMWFWHEISWELDNFLIKVWMAVVDAESLVSTLVACFGGDFLMGLKSADEVGDDDLEKVPLISEMLQEIVKILVDRTSIYTLEESVRRDLMHWLFVNERQTHSKLMQLLSLSHRNFPGIDKILNEIADYHEPKLQEHGQYKLKADSWKEFDPFFALYSKADLQKAFENAERGGCWKPEMQFKGVGTEQGDPLQFVFKFFDCNLFYQLIWGSLLVSLKKPSGYAEGSVVTILHLLYHAMDQIERGSIGRTIRSDFKPTSAGFTSNNLKESLAFSPALRQPSILAMLYHIADMKYESEGSSHASDGLSQQSFGASEKLKTCVKYIIHEMKAKGFIDTPKSKSEQSEPMECDNGDDADALKKKRAEHQAAVMASFMAQQEAFWDTITDSDSDMEDLDEKEAESGDGNVSDRSPKGEPAWDPNLDCALCKGEIKDTGSLCWVGHSQVNFLPTKGLKENPKWESAIAKHQRCLKFGCSAQRESEMIRENFLFCPTNSFFDSSFGMNVKTCGHKLHFLCYMNYLSGLKERSRSGLRYEGMNILNLNENEFLCPVCRRLSNNIIPCTLSPENASLGDNGLGHFVNQCKTVFDAFETSFTSKAGDQEQKESKVSLGTPKLLEIIGYNVAHFEVLLRNKNWINVEAAHCAARGQLTILKGLSSCTYRYAQEHNVLSGHQKMEKLSEYLRNAEEQIEAVLMSTESPAAVGVTNKDDVSMLPFVNSFIKSIQISIPDIKSHQENFQELDLNLSVLDEFVRKEIVRYNPKLCEDDVMSLCDPFKLYMESLMYPSIGDPNKEAEFGGCLRSPQSRNHWPLHLSIFQSASYFILDTYCGAMSEHLSLIDNARNGVVELQQSSIDEIYKELQLTFERILDQQYGEILRERMLDFVEMSIEPFIRRSYILFCCNIHREDKSRDLSFESAIDGGLPSVPHMIQQVFGLSSQNGIISTCLEEGIAFWREGGRERFSAKILRKWCPNVFPQIKDICMKSQTDRPSIASVLTSLNYSLVRNPKNTSPSLLKLPDLYQNALVQWLDKKCVKCGKVPKEPALCLVCGQLLCCAENCCKDGSGKGECTLHARTCGARTCVFLLLRQTSILILSGSHACIYSSPYLDAHGEEDPSLKRGKPLFLDKNRYEALNLLWASGAFDYDSKVLKHSHGGSRRMFSAEFY